MFYNYLLSFCIPCHVSGYITSFIKNNKPLVVYILVQSCNIVYYIVAYIVTKPSVKGAKTSQPVEVKNESGPQTFYYVASAFKRVIPNSALYHAELSRHAPLGA